MKKNIVWVMFGGVIILFLLNFSMIFFVPNDMLRLMFHLFLTIISDCYIAF